MLCVNQEAMDHGMSHADPRREAEGRIRPGRLCASLREPEWHGVGAFIKKRIKPACVFFDVPLDVKTYKLYFQANRCGLTSGLVEK